MQGAKCRHGTQALPNEGGDEIMLRGGGLCEGKEKTDRTHERLVSIFFPLDFFQQLFFRLTLNAELRKGDGF
jgi:hypothetical protein